VAYFLGPPMYIARQFMVVSFGVGC